MGRSAQAVDESYRIQRRIRATQRRWWKAYLDGLEQQRFCPGVLQVLVQRRGRSGELRLCVDPQALRGRQHRVYHGAPTTK